MVPTENTLNPMEHTLNVASFANEMEARKPKAVGNALQHLDEELSKLEKTIYRLTDELQPALSKEAPKTAGLEEGRSEGTSELCGAIESKARMVNTLTLHVEDLVERLEV